jgi:hypothetical protein
MNLESYYSEMTDKGEYDADTDPHFLEVNLIVSFNWDVSSSYMNKYKKAIRKASDFMLDITDGMLYLRHVILADNSAREASAHMLVKKGNADDNNDHNWPHVPGGGLGKYLSGGTGSSYAIVMPEKLQGKNPDNSRYYKTIVHEFGHYGRVSLFMEASGTESHMRSQGPAGFHEPRVLLLRDDRQGRL